MAMKFTEEQKRVIGLRGGSILVSAAAGSGKTAVLVERIFQKLVDPERPVMADRLLVMTFTRAAAGEMKERILRRLEEALNQDPDNAHLQRQATLIHAAQITTIHGFCSWLLKNYFHLIDLDPGYRIAEEGEMKLLQEDVLGELLEDMYHEITPEEEAFVEFFASGKSDEGLKSLILQLYEVAMSHPDPDRWLSDCLEDYRIETVEALDGLPFMDLLFQNAARLLQDALELTDEALSLSLGEGGPFYYENTIRADRELFTGLLEVLGEHSLQAACDLTAACSFGRLPSKKSDDVNPAVRDRVKDLRDEYKAVLKTLREEYFAQNPAEVLETLCSSWTPLTVLLDLARQFSRRFAEQKRARGILDFSDLEHLALRILVTETGQKSAAAKELSLRYDEVMVDEYQDSNLLQEQITRAVCGWAENRENHFMVGDVKQSIYRFRLARPDLFMEKYRRFSPENPRETLVILRRNFRSRPEVLSGVNYLFRQLMGEELGGIDYDEDAALYPGLPYPEGGDPAFRPTEILLTVGDTEEEPEEERTDSSRQRSARELEALSVGRRILEMTGKELVMDQATGALRPLEYGDIVILLRTQAGWAETFTEVLASLGIPVYSTSRTGYFSAPEVICLLNYLRICDNPRQDIPLLGVLRSPICSLTDEELSFLRILSPEGLMYDCLRELTAREESPLSEGFEVDFQKLQDKVRLFLEQLDSFRKKSAYTPVYQLVQEILKETGYGWYVRAMPDGVIRSANLAMLGVRAREYEKTSYRGLFHFVRYVENLQKYEVDYGEAGAQEAAEKAVRIMTIHKSKGLEFPVVFVAGMGKQFNRTDENAPLLLHPELGIGVDAFLPEKRLRVRSVKRRILREEIHRESLGEELRVLYVAMTRAREKLILSGTVKDPAKQIGRLARYAGRREWLLGIGTRQNARTALDFVLPALAGHPCMDGLFEQFGIFTGRSAFLREEPELFTLRLVTSEELVAGQVSHLLETESERTMYDSWDPERVVSPKIRREIRERFGFASPYRELEKIPVKVSVSELKKRSYHEDSDLEESQFQERPEPIIPRFMMEQEETLTGAGRGTAYHRVMECLDYGRIETDEALKEQIREMTEQQKLSEEEASVVRIPDIRKFLDTTLGQRMRAAAACGRLFREQPFMIGRPARDLDSSWDSDRMVLVQGIIDAYFYEDDGIVLVDYKTDQVRPGEEQRLIDLYHIQLEDYACALERMTKKKVKETYIYSFTLGKTLDI